MVHMARSAPSARVTTESVEHFRSTQSIMPDWMKQKLAGLNDGDMVEVVRQVYPFGTYVVAINVSEVAL